MEFALAVFGAVVSTAVPKLCTVISKLTGKAKIDATVIKNDLMSIQGIIQGRPSIGVYASHFQRGWIAQLRCLAYDIEDCIDRFDVKKMTREEFAKEIDDLKVRAKETTEQLLRYMGIAETWAQASSVPPAPSAAVPLPQELQVLLGNQRQWLVDNRNCLLYLCLFPRNHPVRRNPLIRRWLAEGLVRDEQVAVQNLEILINSSIINSIQKSINGKVKRCQPPDATLREYIYQQSMSENFMLFCDGAAQLQVEMESARRLSVHPNGAAHEGLNLPGDLSRLRTLAVFPAGASLASYEEAILNFTRYQVLRVLDLKECGHLSETRLEAICDQWLMKYLSIWGSPRCVIPRTIGDLKQLETLDLRGDANGIVTVYYEVLLLPKLKHLLGKIELSTRDTLFGTSYLKKQLQKKSALETLAGFVVRGTKGFPQLMSFMRRLRKVKIWCESNASQANLRAISTAITEFIRDGNNEPGHPGGRSLSIDFQQYSGEFLNALQVDGSLASLKLRGSLSSGCPPFVARLRGIEELCLWSTSTTLSWNEMLAELSMLSVLKYLKLVEDNLGPIVIRPEHLRSLERICLVSERGLDITIQALALPRLVSLHLLCPDLRVIPGTPGVEIAHMAGLTEVALHPRVDQGIEDKWRIAAMGHPKAPKVVMESP